MAITNFPIQTVESGLGGVLSISDTVHKTYTYKTDDSITDVKVTDYFSAVDFGSQTEPRINCQCSDGDYAVKYDVASGVVSVVSSGGISQSASFENRPLVIGALGDSITNNNIGDLYSAGMGTNMGWAGRNWLLRTCAKLGGRAWADIRACEGFSGRRTDQVYAEQYDAAYTKNVGPSDATPIPRGVLAIMPDICIEFTGTNDLLADTTLEYMLQGRIMLWERLKQNGIVPVALSLLPRGDDVGRAALVPTWNAAIKNAADRYGVMFVDVYTPCANGSGGWRDGYDWVNDAVDPTGLHPGAEGCEAMADAIARAITPLIGERPSTPTFISSANPAYSAAYDASKLGYEYLYGNAFSSTSGFGIRYETDMVTSRTVSQTGLEDFGNSLVITIDSYASETGGFSDTVGPSTAVTAGDTIGFFFKLRLDSKNREESFVIGLQGGSTAGELIYAVKNSSSNGAASTAEGASFNYEMDIYQEIIVPTGVATVRPYISIGGSNNSSYPNIAGAVLEIANMGIVKIN